jgi:hypothetical protein
MNKIISFILIVAVAFVFGATYVRPSTYKVEAIQGAAFDVYALETTLATNGDSAFSNPISIAGLTFQAYDSLGQKAKLDYRLGMAIAVCQDTQDTNSTTTVDSVNTVVYIQASDLAASNGDPNTTGSDSWYAVDSMKVLGNGDGGAKVKRTKAITLANEASGFIRIKLVGVSGNSYSVAKCKIRIAKKDAK